MHGITTIAIHAMQLNILLTFLTGRITHSKAEKLW